MNYPFRLIDVYKNADRLLIYSFFHWLLHLHHSSVHTFTRSPWHLDMEELRPSLLSIQVLILQQSEWNMVTIFFSPWEHYFCYYSLALKITAHTCDTQSHESIQYIVSGPDTSEHQEEEKGDVKSYTVLCVSSPTCERTSSRSPPPRWPAPWW